MRQDRRRERCPVQAVVGEHDNRVLDSADILTALAELLTGVINTISLSGALTYAYHSVILYHVVDHRGLYLRVESDAQSD
jgi:hypothetical protein